MRVKDASPLSYKLSSSFILFFYCSFADFSICLNTNFFPSFILDIFSVFWLLWPEENAVRQKRMLMFAVLHQFQLRHFFPHYTLFFSRSRNWECGFCMVHSRSYIKNWLKQFWILYIFFYYYILFLVYVLMLMIAPKMCVERFFFVVVFFFWLRHLRIIIIVDVAVDAILAVVHAFIIPNVNHVDHYQHHFEIAANIIWKYGYWRCHSNSHRVHVRRNSPIYDIFCVCVDCGYYAGTHFSTYTFFNDNFLFP